MISIRLPLPPSVNNLYANNRRTGGRYKTARYRRWEKAADGYLLEQMRAWREVRQWPISGHISIVLRVPADARADVSNLMKAPEDLLVSRGITPDDRHNWSVTATKDPSVPRGFCIVEIMAGEAVA